MPDIKFNPYPPAPLKFSQIASVVNGATETLFGLTANGEVFRLKYGADGKPKGWVPITMQNLKD